MKKWCSVAFILSAIPCLAQSPPPATDDPSRHANLAEIAATLKQIERTLKEQTEIQKADLLLRRVAFASTQLAAAQEKLRRISEEIRTRRDEGAELETGLTLIEKETPASDTAAAVHRARIAETKSRMTNAQDRLNALEQDRVAAENEIQTLRREARDWQAFLDKTLTSQQ